MAGGDDRASVLALCSRAGSCRTSRLRTLGNPARRVAVDRMARRGGKAGQILAFDPAEKHYLPQARGPHQTALAYRARLSRAQTRGRARTFRRTRLARLPPPCHAVHVTSPWRRELFRSGLKHQDNELIVIESAGAESMFARLRSTGPSCNPLCTIHIPSIQMVRGQTMAG